MTEYQEIVKEIDLPTINASLRGNGIIKVVTKRDDIDEEHVLPHIEALNKLCGGETRKMVVIPHKIGKVTREHFEAIEKHNDKHLIVAEAIVTPPLHVRMILAFIVRVHKPTRPIQFFRTEEAAVDWLTSLAA